MSQENVEVVGSFYEALARRDTEAIEALVREHPPAADVVFESALTGQLYKGEQGLWDLVADIWETLDYVPAAEEFIDAGDQVVVVLRISGRGAHSGVPVTQRVGIVWTFERGTLVRGKSFTSRAAALEAAGLSE